MKEEDEMLKSHVLSCESCWDFYITCLEAAAVIIEEGEVLNLLDEADSLAANNEWDKAIALYEEALKIEPDNLEIKRKVPLVLESGGEKSVIQALVRQVKRGVYVIKRGMHTLTEVDLSMPAPAVGSLSRYYQKNIVYSDELISISVVQRESYYDISIEEK